MDEISLFPRRPSQGFPRFYVSVACWVGFEVLQVASSTTPHTRHHGWYGMPRVLQVQRSMGFPNWICWANLFWTKNWWPDIVATTFYLGFFIRLSAALENMCLCHVIATRMFHGIGDIGSWKANILQGLCQIGTTLSAKCFFAGPMSKTMHPWFDVPDAFHWTTSQKRHEGPKTWVSWGYFPYELKKDYPDGVMLKACG